MDGLLLLVVAAMFVGLGYGIGFQEGREKGAREQSQWYEKEIEEREAERMRSEAVKRKREKRAARKLLETNKT